jgi:hypothetical protein
MLGIIVGALCLVFFIGMLFYKRVYERRLKTDNAGMHAWSNDHGYAFADVDDSWTGRWRFAPFGIGKFQHAKNVVSGDYRGLGFAAFDYSFDESASAQSHVWHYAIVVFQLPDDRPWLDVRDRKVHLKGPDANEFTIGDKAFDDEWRIHSDNEAYTRSVLTESTRASLGTLKPSGIHLVDGRLFVWWMNSHNDAAVLPGRVEGVSQIAAALPAAV